MSVALQIVCVVELIAFVIFMMAVKIIVDDIQWLRNDHEEIKLLIRKWLHFQRMNGNGMDNQSGHNFNPWMNQKWSSGATPQMFGMKEKGE